MQIEIKVPSVGESVTEALLAQWFKNDGDPVKKDEPLFVIETDKVTLEVVAEAAAAAQGGQPDEPAPAEPAKPVEPEPPPPEPAKAAPEPEPVPAPEKTTRSDLGGFSLAPSVRRLVAEKNLDPALITGTGPNGRITKTDVVLYLESASPSEPVSPPHRQAAAPADQEPAKPVAAAETVSRKPMSPIRQRIAARLLEAKHSTAMLTTFNEIDMSSLMDIRTRYKEAFKQKYGVNLGMMSFFIKACVEALKEIPQINAFIDGKDFIEHHYYHIGVAVGSERGLVVPVIRHADQLSFAGLEQAIVDYVNKIKENRLELADLEGGTFTISNGGVYGSLLSTPILNTPQSAILGMHKIEKRPVVIDDEIVIRTMMYVALSYDHRIVDGKEAVTFLKRIKEFVENPERMMMEI